jgi:hypothetical protein
LDTRLWINEFPTANRSAGELARQFVDILAEETLEGCHITPAREERMKNRRR